jgi:predicted 3-demethylubiquinone-9 3-methyltransferase (glyoxalase superfamily)
MQKITPFLWFDGNAEEAANYYVSTFKNSSITNVSRYGGEAGEPGTAITVSFQLEGQELIALNGGPHYQFTPAISLFVDCKDQAEVDALWDKLGDGGEELQCGWITDKFGLTWQIIPSILGQLLQDPEPEKSGKAMQAMLQMRKIEVDKLVKAVES